MKRKIRVQFAEGRYGLLLFLIMLIGAALRLIDYPRIPAGLNQDEASSMYEAFSLAHTGMDRWGNAWPAYFPSWGSGQNVLLSYLSIPIVRTLGLSVFSARLIPVSLGILTVPLLAFGLRPLGKWIALMAAFVIAIVPWHFMMSRWALESNLAPFFMLAGCVMLSRALITNQRRWILPCLVPFALALYAYGTTILILPVIAAAILITFRTQFKMRPAAWIGALAAFLFIALPFGIFFLKNHILGHDLNWTHKLPFSTPMLAGTRLDDEAGPWIQILCNNLAFFTTGFQDGMRYNQMPGFPALLVFTLPMTLVGIVLSIQNLTRRIRLHTQASKEDILISIFLFWALACLPLLALFIQNVNRFNHFFVPAIVLAVWATHQLLFRIGDARRLRGATMLIVAWLTLEGGLAIRNYFTAYDDEMVRSGFPVGLDEAFAAAQKLPVAQIKTSWRIHECYIYMLFYTQCPPDDFRRDAVVRKKGTDYVVDRVGRFVFNDEKLNPNVAYGYLVHRGDEGGASREVLFTNDAWEVGIVKRPQPDESSSTQ